MKKVRCNHADLCLSFVSDLSCPHDRYHTKSSMNSCDEDQCDFLRGKTDDYIVCCTGINEERKQKLLNLEDYENL